MNYTEYKSEMMSHLRNIVGDLNKLNATTPFDYLEACVPPEVIKGIDRVVLTGCGDSYCTAIAAKPAFDGDEIYGEKGGTPADSPRAVDFTRYYNTFKTWAPGEAEKTLLGVVSISGNPIRNTEALQRMQTLGGKTVAFTNNPSGIFAASAQHVVNLNVPPFEHPAPNVTSYLASMFVCMMFGLYVGVVKGHITESEATRQRKAAMAYVNAFAGIAQDAIAKQAFEISQQWNESELSLMDFVADGPDYATAFFGSAKMVESFGGLTTIDDTEDWNHINVFNRTPERIGTFLIANAGAPSFGRSLETARTMALLGRRLVVITDADRSLFPESAAVFSLPKSACAWANPLMQHLPMSYIAAYLGIMTNSTSYRRDSASHNKNSDRDRLTGSQIVIV